MGVRIVILLGSMLLLFSCSALKDYPAVGGVNKKDYIKIYKVAVLCGCLNEITDNEFGKSLYYKYNDIGLYSEVAVLGHYITQEAQEVGAKYVKRLKQVKMPDVEGRKNAFSSCVYYVFYDKEVDSIARATYNEMKNAKLEYEYDE